LSFWQPPFFLLAALGHLLVLLPFMGSLLVMLTVQGPPFVFLFN
jgi:hypothetical protein